MIDIIIIRAGNANISVYKADRIDYLGEVSDNLLDYYVNLYAGKENAYFRHNEDGRLNRAYTNRARIYDECRYGVYKDLIKPHSFMRGKYDATTHRLF